ncbi:MAG TPA: hypothetical protein VMT46_03470 [Anaerolineaceae bacterium]|nr:hypothetical protein [Anaerolineaceae bacterium]
MASIVAIALVHGLIYLFVVPPWQHYDEPTHFEYVWMIANYPAFPKEGEYVESERQIIHDSMVRHNFFKTPDLEPLKSNPGWVGVNQIGDKPLYYLLASIPVRFMKSQPVENQLYAVRSVSLLLFLLTILISVLFSAEIFSQGSPLRWLFPLSIALLPAFVDLMTAASPDSAAILVYSLFLLLGVRILKYGLMSWIYVLMAFFLVIAGFFTKTSTWLMVIPFGAAIFLSVFHGKKTLLGWGILLLSSLAFMFVLFSWGDAAYWYRSTGQTEFTRFEIEKEDRTFYAYQLVGSPTNPNPALYQTLPENERKNISGKRVTIGAWVWADHPMKIFPPRLMTMHSNWQKDWSPVKPVTVTQDPVFIAYTVDVPPDPGRAYVVLNPVDGLNESGSVYYQNPILAVGEYEVRSSPIYFDRNAKAGKWNGQKFTNLIRNAGLIEAWPKFNNFVYDLGNKIDYRLAEGMSWYIYSLDINGTSWYITSTMQRLFRTFWATFSWGQVALLGSKPYRFLFLFTMLGILGSIYGGIKKFNWTGLQIALWLCLNILLSLGYAWFTGISMESYISKPAISVARFIFPSIFAIMAIFHFGWGSWIEITPFRYRKFMVAAYILIFAALDLNSVISISAFFRN